MSQPGQLMQRRFAGSWWAWPVVLLPTLVIAVARWNAGAGPTAEDYAQYLLHARALVEGRPYGDTGYIWSAYAPFVSPRLMPPGEPLLLAAAFLITGFNLFVAKCVTLATLLAFAFVAGRAIERHDGPGAGLVIALLIGLAEPVMAFSTTVNSDMTYCAAVWSVILLVDKPGDWSWGRTAAIVALGLYTMALRTVGVVLVPALLLVAIRRRHELGWRAFAPPVVWTVAGLGAAVATPAATGLFRAVWHRLLLGNVHVASNLNSYRLSAFETLLYPFAGPMANAVWHAAAMALVVAGLVTWIKPAASRLALAYGIVYITALALLPLAQGRYLWPLVPLILLGFWRGLVIATGLARNLWRPWPAWTAPALVALLAAAGTMRLATAEAPGDLASVPDVRALFAVVRAEAARSPMRVAFFKPRVLTLETGVPAMSEFLGAPSVVLEELRHRCITHVVVGGLGTRFAAVHAFNQAVTWRAPLFTRVYANPSFRLFRFDGGRCPATTGGAP